MKVLALDYGSARTGVAVSDPTGFLARPLEVISRAAEPAGLARLDELVADHEPEVVLVGMPLTLRGETGPQAIETGAFISVLQGATRSPDRDLGRALHDRAGAAEWLGRARGRARSRSPFAELARQALTMRRLLAMGAVVGVVAIGAFAVASWLGGDDAAAPPPAPPPADTLKQLKVIFPEGFTVREMADRVAAVRQIAIERRGVTPLLTRAGYLRAVKAAKPPAPFRKDVTTGSMEGFLFPALYEFTQRTPASELVADQLRALRSRFASVSLKYARSKNLTPYDILIIASMIEKETAVPSERRLVAAVIYNRLHNKMPLGIDATIRYGLDIPGTESLTKAALATDSPFNTRLHTGLPPTPIANPGLASIQAAAHPARVDYLYYVRKPNSKRHFFTADEGEFLRAVCDFGYACS